MVDRGYRDHVRDRINERRERANESLEAEEKSLRKYQTYVFGPYRERWDYWYQTGSRKRDVTSSTSYEFLVNHGEKWYPSSMMNWILQCIYDYDEPRYCGVIEVKVSNTTFRSCGRSMRELVKEDLIEIGNSIRRLPSVLDYATKLLGWNIVQDLFSDVKASKLMTSINEFLQEHNFAFPADAYIKIEGRILRKDLIMGVKYYPNRDDNRAYCKDVNKLRTLVGAALQRLILPRNMKQRRNLHYVAEVVPAKNKDQINHRIKKADGYVHLATIIDISNFTGSASNAWLMLAIVAIELAHGKITGKHDNIYCCDGAHFQASALEVIVLYLYLTVGYPCTLHATDEFRNLPGGFLGVNANICVAMLFYANMLSWMSRNRTRQIRYMKSQAGGDDVYILTKIKREDVLSTKIWLRENLSKYVGNIKELNSFIVEDSCDGVVVEGFKFCRKRIQVIEEPHHYVVKSEPAIPLNELLTMTDIPKKPTAQENLMRTVTTELRTFEKDHPEYFELTDALMVIASSKLPYATPKKVITQFYESNLDFVQVGGRFCTPESVKQSNLVSPVFHLNNVYYGTVEQSINYLLCRGSLTIQRVSIGGDIQRVVMTEGEAKGYRSKYTFKFSWDEMVTADPDLVEFLSN